MRASASSSAARSMPAAASMAPTSSPSASSRAITGRTDRIETVGPIGSTLLAQTVTGAKSGGAYGVCMRHWYRVAIVVLLLVSLFVVPTAAARFDPGFLRGGLTTE